MFTLGISTLKKQSMSKLPHLSQPLYIAYDLFNGVVNFFFSGESSNAKPVGNKTDDVGTAV